MKEKNNLLSIFYQIIEILTEGDILGTEELEEVKYNRA